MWTSRNHAGERMKTARRITLGRKTFCFFDYLLYEMRTNIKGLRYSNSDLADAQGADHFMVFHQGHNF